MTSVALDEGIATQRIRNSPGDILVDQVETFCMIQRPRVSDIMTIKEMFYSLIGKTDTNQKRRISNALAQNSYVPRQLALFMALQPVEIATPVLLCSPVLGERDLRAILDKSERSHAYIIARRHDLTAKIVTHLLAIDKSGSLKQVLKKNESARAKFSAGVKSTFSPINEEPVIQAVAPQIVDKPASPDQQTNVETNATEKIQSRNQDLLKLARLGKEGKRQRKQGRLQRPPFKPAAFGQRLIALLRDDNRDGFAREVEAACGLNKELVANYVDEANTGTLASILFLLSVPHYTAARILLLVCPKIGRDHSIFVRIMREFSKLDRTAAIAYFQQQDNKFSLPAKEHHIIEARPMFNALRRDRQQTKDGKITNTRRDVERLKAG